jgi:hypothetical protein
MVERKIARLTAEQRRMLEAASVQGFRFDAAIVASAVETDASAAEEVLDELDQKHRLVRFSGEQEFPDSSFTLRYTFSHALYQETLYSGLRPTRRAALSGAIADQLLRRQRGAGAEIASQLAPLYEAARNRDRAAEFFTIAAANAAKLGAGRQAAVLAARALDNAEKVEGGARDRRVLDAALRLAEARQSLGEFEQSIAQFEAAAAAAERLGDREAQAGAISASAISAGWMKQLDEMRERATRALAIAGPATAAGAYAESVLAFERIFAGDVDTAYRYEQRALPLLRERGPAHAAVFAANNSALLHQFRSEYREAASVLAWSSEKARSEGINAELLRGMWIAGMVQANQGRISEAIGVLSDGMRLAELNGERYWLSRFPNTLGWVFAESLDFESALRLNAEGVQAGREADTPETEANSHINLASVQVALGDYDAAWQHLSEGERILNRHPHKNWLRWRFNIRLDLEMASYWVAREQPAETRSSAESALARAEKVGAHKHIAAARKLLGDAAILEDRLEQASREYMRALSVLRHHPCPLVEWKILDAAAAVAARIRDQDRAERCSAQCAAVVTDLERSIADERMQHAFRDGMRRRLAARTAAHRG